MGTGTEQNHNRSNIIWVPLGDERVTLKEAAKRLGASPQRLKRRLQREGII